MINYHDLGGLINKNYVSHSFGGWKSEIKVLDMLVLSMVWKEDTVPCLS